VTVGRVGRPHGLDGSVVVERASEVPGRFAVGAILLAGHGSTRVAAAKRSGGRLVVRLDPPVPRGTELELRRSELPDPEPDTFYVFQLVGLAVEEEGGRPLGVVADVEEGVANDVLELEGGLRLPLVEDCVLAVDLAAARIVVAPGFADPG